MRFSAAIILTGASCTSAWPSLLEPRQANSAISPSAFRRRGYQSTAVLNGWAYIDGGEFSYETGTEITYQYSSTLIAINLSQDWINSSVTLNSISKPSGVPNLVQSGSIWIDENAGVLYTGFAGRQSTFGNGAYQPYGWWSFKPDNSGSGTWTNLNSTVPGFQTEVRPFSPLVASGGGAGYMLGGFVVNGSAADPRTYAWSISGLVTYNYTTNKLSNTTVGDEYTGGVDQMGGMLYIPNFGEDGILLVVGGDQVGKNKPYSDALLSFSTVAVYDIASGNWYDQETSGDIPEDRKEYCSAGIASINNTYEILIYAGWNGNLGPISVPYDEAYVLSLPAFRWFKAPYPAAHPRHAVSCVPVGGGQIMTVGGVDTTQNGPDSLYNDVFNTSDPFEQGLAIFDMNAMAFVPSYTAKPPSYTGASLLHQYYASSRTPSWSNPSLSAVFAVSSFPSSPSSSPSSTGSSPSSSSSSSSSGSTSSSSSHTNTGAIAGGVVGGVVGLALIAGIFFLLSRRARQSRVTNKVEGNLQQSPVEVGESEPQMHEMPHNPREYGAAKHGGPPNGSGYVPRGADHNVVQFEGPPREMPAN